MSYMEIAVEGYKVLRDFFTKPMVGQVIETFSHGSTCHTGKDIQDSKNYLNCTLASYMKDTMINYIIVFIIMVTAVIILAILAVKKIVKIVTQYTNNMNQIAQSNSTNQNIQSVNIPMSRLALSPVQRANRIAPPRPQAPCRQLRDTWVRNERG